VAATSSDKTDKPPEKPLGLGARLRSTAEVVRNAKRTLAMVAEVDRTLLSVLIVTQLLEATGNVAVAWVGKQIIDAVVMAMRVAPHPWAPSLRWVGIELGLVAGLALVSQVQTYANVLLRAKLGLHVNLVILEKASNVSYSHFEDPEFMNSMTQARREASTRPLSLVSGALSLVRNSITLVGYLGLLWALGPWAMLVLVATAVPPFLAEARHGRRMFALQRARTQRNRKTFYLESLLTTEQTVKEIKLFALARWLIERYREIHLGFHAEETVVARARARAAFLLGLLATLALYGTYALIVTRTIAGAITLGSMTLYITVFRQGQTTLQRALSSVAGIYEDNLFMSNLFEYLGVPDDEPDEPLTKSDDVGGAPPRLVFEGLTFRYPGAERDALTDVNLTIESGETLALVGRNGAGKTTLVKLLVGLHRPTAGRILIDDVDVADMTAGALRRRVGIIFQDFARFQFSAGENVGVGWLPDRDDQQAIERAVEDAGAKTVIDRLPKRLETPLGRAFGGDDLSVGQWQRIALARAFMRKSRILVLDEPTASMDAEAEHEIFQRFRDLKAQRTALLITHRFSTVRMADRIAVFEDGRMVELGSHAELLAENGRYAKMFRLQAEGYRDD
jgi:ATP-binding cassette subfamily B protein